MRCPKCGSRMMCRSTRELEGERVLRYRTCERCGASAPTIERLVRVSRIAHAEAPSKDVDRGKFTVL